MPGQLASFFRNLLRKRTVEQALDDELQAAMELLTQEKVKEGLSHREARRQALIELGGIEQIKEGVRAIRLGMFLETSAQDLRFGLRTMAKSPGFTLVAVLSLALGIGANTAIFTILNSAALRLLPVPHADQLVTVGQNVRAVRGSIHRNVHDDETFVSYAEYKAYAKENTVFSGVLAYSSFTDTTLGGDKPQPILGTLTSCNYFDVLQIGPALGRFFADSDCAAPGESPVVVLGYATWQETFAGDRSIIGQSITLNHALFRVIGVAPREFDGTEVMASAFWAPLTMEKAFRPASDYLADDFLSWLAVIGRLKPGISVSRATTNLNMVASRLNSLQPGRMTTVTLGRATRLSAPSMRTPLLMIGGLVLAAVSLVLLLACANIGSLLLARAAGRRKEIAARLVLGAGRFRLIRQLLTESLLLALVGGVAGALGSLWSVAAIVRLAVAHLPVSPEFSLALNVSSDFHTWLYAFGLSILTACCFGLAPALRSSRTDLSLAMRDDAAQLLTGTSGGRLRNSLVCIQVAACMLLLLASALLLHGLYRAQTLNPGFQTNNIEAVAFDLSSAGYTKQRAATFQQQLGERLATLPGVDAVAQAISIPLGNSHNGTAFSLPNKSNEYQVEYNNVSSNFFQVLAIPVLEGRTFTDAEEHTGAHVVVLSQATARRFFPARNPIGQLLLGGDSTIDQFVAWRVVGVAADAQVANLGNPSELYLYEPAGPLQQAALNVMVHSAAANPVVAKEISAIIGDLDPGLAVTIGPLSETLEFWRAPARVASVLSVILGALALLLASIGIYGMVSYSVSQRVREIGIRRALGANNRDVMWLLIQHTMLPVAIGALVGILLCGIGSSIFSAILFGVSPLDPSSFLGMPAFMLAVALLACYIPARRAMRVDPTVALRYE